MIKEQQLRWAMKAYMELRDWARNEKERLKEQRATRLLKRFVYEKEGVKGSCNASCAKLSEGERCI